ncbi:MAG: tRNA-(ms[2]io[6]A)-hydroxylase [Alphaproteobacteria bacterium]|nr:tRNA-(ms[2]io[6]A)-hydroxylase [Alphaproteobacteria bacterium]
MLRLRSSSSPIWLDRALGAMGDILLDHAHCEKKAASTAVSLIFRYQDKPWLLVPLSELAREELEHFERVVALIRARGGEFGRQEPSPYASELHKVVRRGEPHRLIDTLICCAFIEARSCERMKLLSEHLPDPELAALYGDLLASEARHHQTYLDLAAPLLSREALQQRVLEIGEHEAAVIASAPPLPRLHCG